jgi:WhiB family redox-sensing transcriptional regulator
VEDRIMTSPSDDWMRDGTPRPCTANPELWFSQSAKDKARAIRACGACPLLQSCQEYALTTQPPYGVWGGLTVRERRPSGAPAVTRRNSLVPVDCTSPTSYAQHRRRGETCEPCQAKRAAQVEGERRARLTAEHAAVGGSMIGYHTHKALGEPPCALCRDVNKSRCAAIRAARRTRRNQPVGSAP